MFPALDNAIEQAALIGSGRDASQYIPIASDLHIAWREAVVCTRTALARNLTSPTSGVPSLDAWLLATDSDVRNIRAMPQKAQRELSASVKALQVADFETDARADQSPGALRRFKNWLAECDRQAGRWTQAVPWQREGKNSLSSTFASIVAPCEVSVT